MYLWKCWYSTRWIVAIYLTILACITALALYHAPLNIDWFFDSSTLWRITSFFVPLATTSAWILGSIGLSRDIADGSGAYLLSQPRSIGFFVWRDVAVAMGELLLFVLLPIGLFLAATSLHAIRFDGRTNIPDDFARSPYVPISQVLPIILSAFICAALIYGVSYLFTALLRRTGLSIFLSAAFYLVYSTLSGKAHNWAAPYKWFFPAWRISPFEWPYSDTMNSQMLLALGMRAAAVVLFIFMAQLFIQKVEIRA